MPDRKMKSKNENTILFKGYFKSILSPPTSSNSHLYLARSHNPANVYPLEIDHYMCLI